MSRDEDYATHHGRSLFGRSSERNAPMLAVRVKGSLGVACPKCQASPGHACRSLVRLGNREHGSARSKPHPERVEAAR